MKKFIFLILLSIFSIGVVSAQSKINYEQKGTNFVQTTTRGSSTFDVKTTYTWEIKRVQAIPSKRGTRNNKKRTQD